ncbi:nuclear transport factor 2 family protein [Nakamurella lactea]|uniref:nuclear transport factor 2 family protein n=1 Tax=Nakamurella lactea TaxID=459515 RepID=UPI000414FA79|nr:nuclear transport factor 2 family protein [Nakamurella lactea]
MNDQKRLVITAMQELIGKGNLDAVEPLMREDFVDHNPQVSTSSRADWIAFFRDFPLKQMRIEILRLFADDEFVTMFSRRWLADGSVILVSDVFRVTDGLIAEHWEVVQPIDGDTNPLATLSAG